MRLRLVHPIFFNVRKRWFFNQLSQMNILNVCYIGVRILVYIDSSTKVADAWIF